MQLARRRLWIGITNVGFWVLAACAGLCGLMIFRAEAPDWRLLIVIGIAVIAAQAAFDFIGGVTLMPGPRPSVVTFLRGWLRGVLGHALVLAGVGFVSAISLRLTGGFGAGILLATLALALGRHLLLRVIGGVATTDQTHDGEKILTAAVNDPAFTGGIVGLGRRAKSLLPASWMETLPKPELAAESSRRHWQIANALPARAFLLIVCWNLLGTFTGTQVFHLTARPPSVALLGHACWMTLWAFASLLVLPALSRKAVFAADAPPPIPDSTLAHGLHGSPIWSAKTAAPTPPCRLFSTPSHPPKCACASSVIHSPASSLAISPAAISTTRGPPSRCSAVPFTATSAAPRCGSFHHRHEASRQGPSR